MVTYFGILLILWGFSDLAVDIWLEKNFYHELGIKIPEIISPYTHWIVMGIGGGIIWMRQIWTGSLNDHSEKTQELSIKIAMAVAMADRRLDDSEGEIISNWIRRGIESLSGGEREGRKEKLNNAMKESYSAFLDGAPPLAELTSALNHFGDASTKFDTIELCFEVMAADGHMDPEEIQIIHQIGDALELDPDEINALRDQTIVKLNPLVSKDAGIEGILGIASEWNDDEKRDHLRSEFLKWNNRLNTLPEGEERENVQAMLNLIGDARLDYNERRIHREKLIKLKGCGPVTADRILVKIRDKIPLTEQEKKHWDAK